MTRTAYATLVMFVGAMTALAGQVPGLPGSTQDELAGDLRGLLLKNLPNPLYETSRDWGRQTEARRLPIRGKMRGSDGDLVREPRNDGLWQKLRVDAVNPNETLVFDLRNVVNPEPGRLT